MKKSTKDLILSYLRRNCGKVFSGAELETTDFGKPAKASVKGRRLRELAEDGLIERKEINGLVHYFVGEPKKEVVGYTQVWSDEEKKMVTKEIINTKW